MQQLSALQSTLVQQDKDGDCVLSTRDIAIAVAMRIDTSPSSVPDLDGDGLITGSDTVLLIEKTILSSVGDVDGSRIISSGDLLMSLQDTGSTGSNLRSDVTGDAVVDTVDVVAICNSLNTTISLDSLGLANAIYSMVVEYDFLDQQGLLVAINCGIFDGDNWPDGDHLTQVSRFYPATHNNSISDFAWPPNHLPSISSTWTPCPVGCHGTSISSVEQWPPNHLYAISKDWSPQLPGNHTLTMTLNAPPPPHAQNLSTQWKDKPNHVVNLSSSYPATHPLAISKVWPPNHPLAISLQPLYPDPGDHHFSISTTHTHAANVSITWPPSHVNIPSLTWSPQGHVSTTSIGWPASHSSFASSSWPPNTYPGIWPPNHHGGVSNSWGAPPPVPPGLWPPGHAWIPSGLQFVPGL